MQEEKTQRGFTLIEIMVVVVIIGLLAGFVGPAVWQLFMRSQEDIAEQMCKDIYDKVNLWKTLTKAKRVPTDLSELEEPITRSADEPFYVVTEDPWGTKYWIERIDNRKFRIWSAGPDGQEGTEDDISWPSIEER